VLENLKISLRTFYYTDVFNSYNDIHIVNNIVKNIANKSIKTYNSHMLESYILYLYKRPLLHASRGLLMFIELNQLNFHSFFVHNQFYPQYLLYLFLLITSFSFKHIKRR
jgi:hypothetical protein